MKNLGFHLPTTGSLGSRKMKSRCPNQPSKVSAWPNILVLSTLLIKNILQSFAGEPIKYDRMFECKNQNIFSEHYAKLIGHQPIGGSPLSDPEDFIAFKCDDRDLDDAGKFSINDPADAQTFTINFLKRKQKVGKVEPCGNHGWGTEETRVWR